MAFYGLEEDTKTSFLISHEPVAGGKQLLKSFVMMMPLQLLKRYLFPTEHACKKSNAHFLHFRRINFKPLLICPIAKNPTRPECLLSHEARMDLIALIHYHSS